MDPRSHAVRYQSAGPTPPREVIAVDPLRSFRSFTHDFPSEVCGWAAHPEYEIHLIQKSTGAVIAGDYVGTFEAGHVSMMGPHLPHDWVSDLAPGEVVIERDAVVQFTDEWIRGCMSLMPELDRLDRLLQVSGRGLEFHGATALRAADMIVKLGHSAGPVLVARMIELLGILADAPPSECVPLASPLFGNSDSSVANQAVEAGLSHIFDNLTGDVRLSTAASLAHMSEPTFSKYFKRASGVTFSNMVKRLRIAHARRLLDTTDDSTASIARASGYRNMSNFNRQFLAEVGMTPTTYRQLEPGERPAALPTRADTALTGSFLDG